eukprot:TRINITY_DN24795_c0_g1_i2.p1 TRINITY_DN24795_c0_g1~~TRINITY_DN24795_c0_g1_i2.p1  ORF type:complete len:131 (-),score=9.79 TRINITY_DN24795_c0_g1_i2:94-486(-)
MNNHNHLFNNVPAFITKDLMTRPNLSRFQIDKLKDIANRMTNIRNEGGRYGENTGQADPNTEAYTAALTRIRNIPINSTSFGGAMDALRDSSIDPNVRALLNRPEQRHRIQTLEYQWRICFREITDTLRM